ncbi:hypothetical protein L2E82_45686 [Cichorium intybus]|uniref:Uncharacterized protein n=1 Tax=Cichorium intybus TaxID=13427 RepID=A0ACB8ZV11_CICIN|nr:hypothetical protein L2E82_45686 [Cichorium intybus]
MSSNPSTSSTSGGGGGSSGGGPCGACKFLRRKCVAGCIFAPYFDSDQGAAHFAAVHKVFGASNVSKLLFHLPVQRRHDAVVTICYEAQARLRDPVYGCVSHIFALQQQVVNLQAELSYFQAHLATLEGPTPPPPPPPQSLTLPPGLTISDLPTASSLLGSYDLTSLLEPMVPPSWTMQPIRRPMDPRQFMSSSTGRAQTDILPSQGDASDLQELARELLHRPSNLSSEPMSCKTEGSNLPPHSR